MWERHSELSFGLLKNSPRGRGEQASAEKQKVRRATRNAPGGLAKADSLSTDFISSTG